MYSCRSRYFRIRTVETRFLFDSFSLACGLDSIELELDFVFTSSSDSKQLDMDKDIWWARGHSTRPGWTYLGLKVEVMGLMGWIFRGKSRCGETEGLYSLEYSALLKFHHFLQSVRIVDAGSMRESEDLEHVRPGYCCAFKAYFESCRMIFPVPRLLLEVLAHLRMAFPQMHPNFVRHVITCAVRAREKNIILDARDVKKLFSVKHNTRFQGSFYTSPRTNRHVLTNTPITILVGATSHSFSNSIELPLGSSISTNIQKNGPLGLVSFPTTFVLLVLESDSVTKFCGLITFGLLQFASQCRITRRSNIWWLDSGERRQIGICSRRNGFVKSSRLIVPPRDNGDVGVPQIAVGSSFRDGITERSPHVATEGNTHVTPPRRNILVSSSSEQSERSSKRARDGNRTPIQTNDRSSLNKRSEPEVSSSSRLAFDRLKSVPDFDNFETSMSRQCKPTALEAHKTSLVSSSNWGKTSLGGREGSSRSSS
ncbi:unnamed protein product [Microthlaspi erraticum]|uniref:Uncharacterized protein n=1 Tax=Microthlaspi erraticum TaxID=1685480 RepID=A0A6D2I6K2_9BRAS|nr:unnamed protein product [Microthlaspi erraticum]